MFSISAVRTALAAQIGALAVPELRSLAEPEDQVTPPCGIVEAGRPYAAYGVTLEGATGFLGAPSAGVTLSPREFNLDYLIVVSHASTMDRVQSALDTWLGFEADAAAVSVPAAVAADPTLGGLVEWCQPLTADKPAAFDYNGALAYGTRIHFSLSARTGALWQKSSSLSRSTACPSS